MPTVRMALAAIAVAIVLPAQAEEPSMSARKGMLEAHNAVRAGTGVNLPPLQWSDRLAQAAAMRAGQLAASSCGASLDGKIGPYGENVFWASSITKAVNLVKNDKGQWVWTNQGAAQPISAKTVVDFWAEEEQWYSAGANQCAAPDDRDCSHYKQIVARRTTRLGCAMELCPDNSQVWVCNYDPRANFENLAPY